MPDAKPDAVSDPVAEAVPAVALAAVSAIAAIASDTRMLPF